MVLTHGIIHCYTTLTSTETETYLKAVTHWYANYEHFLFLIVVICIMVTTFHRDKQKQLHNIVDTK